MALTEEQRNPWRAIVAGSDYNLSSQDWEDLLTELDSIYSKAPIAPPASERNPIAWATTNEDGDYAMLFFDQQEARNYSGDDEPIGLAPVSSSAPQPDYKAQRDELMEALGIAQATINCAGISTPKIVRDAVEKYAAIASVKGGE